jgi:hypothetical protein
VIGVLLCFALGLGLVFAIRWSRRRSAARAAVRSFEAQD